MQELPTDFFCLDSPPGAATLIGRVQRPLSELEAVQVCEWMLNTAIADNQSYWLLDARPDSHHKSAKLTQWQAEDFLPRAAQLLRTPLRLAYLFGPAQLKLIVEAESYDTWHLLSIQNRIAFFGEETLALQWLANLRDADIDRANMGGPVEAAGELA